MDLPIWRAGKPVIKDGKMVNGPTCCCPPCPDPEVHPVLNVTGPLADGCGCIDPSSIPIGGPNRVDTAIDHTLTALTWDPDVSAWTGGEPYSVNQFNCEDPRCAVECAYGTPITGDIVYVAYCVDGVFYVEARCSTISHDGSLLVVFSGSGRLGELIVNTIACSIFSPGIVLIGGGGITLTLP